MDFYGYPRPDGQYGARNIVALIPSTGCVNAVVQQIEKMISGTRAFTHHQGCLHPPQDTRRVTNTLINLGKNPNVAAALVVGLGCEMVDMEEVKNGIKKSGKTCEVVHFHNLGGSLETIYAGSKIAAKMAYQASRLRREKAPLSKLCFCTKCGSSDTTSGLSSNLVVGEVCRLMTEEGGTFIQGEVCDIMGGENNLKDLCINPSDGDRIIDFVKDLYNRGCAVGADVRGSQMTTGNVAGGLTTLIEKAMGANAKGQKVPISGTIEYGERPCCQGGRQIISTPGHGFENLTGGAAAGSQLILFTTGRGAPNGHPCIPAIKICGNKKTNTTLQEHVDVDVTSIIEETETVKEAGERLFKFAIDVASGSATKSEILKYDSAMEILINGPVM
jgi:altronate dehydratase large subunit